jgi:hypothetical protein
MQWGGQGYAISDKEVAAPTSCCYCIIPCPCPSGKSPRTPQVTHLFDGKSSCFRFTFNQLSHFLRLVVIADTYPSRSLQLDLPSKRESSSELLVPAVPVSFFGRYLPLAPRGALSWLSTSASATHTPCGFGKEIISYGRVLNERCKFKSNKGKWQLVL